MQRLYENHKLLTYPRTDSRYISKDIVSTIPDRLKAVATGEFRTIANDLLKNPIKANKSFVDDNKVSDHHAIIPTEEKGNLANLSSDERRVYELVVKRFLSVLMPPFEYIQTTLTGEVNGEKLIAKGKVVKAKGWKKLYDREVDDEGEEDIKEQELPKLKEGDEFKVLKVNVKKGETKPPARFNEGTLLSAMENPQKFISVDKSSAKTLGETGGLGTVATRADIIEKLFNSFVIEKRGKEIIPTSKGKQLIDLVPKDLKSPLLTANWEEMLERISKGKDDSKKFIKDIRNYTVALVEDVKLGESKFHHDNLTGKKCPQCGKYMLEVKGKNGTMNVCQDRECGYRENISRITNARCPECKKKLELRGHGEGKIYVCPGANCNFREKASSFEKRFDKKGKVDKNLLEEMNQKIHHRGPDDTGYFVKDNVGFGFKRLSIIDLAHGHQPFNKKERTIIFNGEIYNHESLREDLIKKGYEFSTGSDTEVLLSSYIENGNNAVNYLRGIFAVVIYDETTNTILGARDHFGIKPLYYTENEDYIAFSSEYKALMPVVKDKSVDNKSLQNYLSFQYVPNYKTMMESIKKVPNGTCFTIENNKIKGYKSTLTTPHP